MFGLTKTKGFFKLLEKGKKSEGNMTNFKCVCVRRAYYGFGIKHVQKKES